MGVTTNKIRRIAAAAAAATCAAAALPAAAHAFPSPTSYTQLGGLNDTTGEWVREYASPPADPLTVYAATEDDGVYRSTNGGVSFSALNSGLVESHGDLHVRAIVATAGGALAGTQGGLFKLNGSSWTPLAQGDEADPQNPKKLNRSVQSLLPGASGQLLAGVFGGGVYKSTDDGATWTPPAPGNGMPSGETVWSLSTLTENLIYAATSSGLYASTDFGTSWTPAGDGVTGTTLRVFVDGDNPNIIYAGTTDGLFRSITFGATWTKENGPVGKQLGNGPVRSMQQKAGIDETRIYATTGQGLYVGTTSNNTTAGFLPGPVTWRKVIPNDAGLNGHTDLWAVSNFIGPIAAGATFIVGSHGGGGFGLTMTPPSNTAVPALAPMGNVQVGNTVSSSSGVWGGTPTIEYEYAWQDCGTGASAVCPNKDTGATIAGADGASFAPTAALQDHWIRSVVTAKNDFPTFGLIKAASAAKKIVVSQDAVPGAGQGAAPGTPTVLDPAQGTSFPVPGSRLRVPDNWNITPCTPGAGVPQCSYSFRWTRCAAGAVSDADKSCELVTTPAGDAVTTQELTLAQRDIGMRFCARVKATNANGSFTTSCSGLTNEIFPNTPVAVTTPFVEGTPVVGASLAGNAGLWSPAPMSYKRQWRLCDAGGNSCSDITGATSAAYKPVAGDVGHTLRILVTVDANIANKFPAPVDGLSAPSAVVTAPVVPGTGGGTGTGTGTGTGGGTGTGTGTGTGGGTGTGTGTGGLPPVDRTAPAVPVVKAPASVRTGTALKLTVKLSEPGTLRVTLQRRLTGRKAAGKACSSTRRTGLRCTLHRTVRTQQVAVAGTAPKALSLATKVAGRRLAKGSYRLLLVAVDAAGNVSKPRTITVRLT